MRVVDDKGRVRGGEVVKSNTSNRSVRYDRDKENHPYLSASGDHLSRHNL